MTNLADRVRIAWALVDGVWGVPSLPRYECDVGGVPMSQRVFDGVRVERRDRAERWRMFFNAHTWHSAMEVEERYYSMAPKSCALSCMSAMSAPSEAR